MWHDPTRKSAEYLKAQGLILAAAVGRKDDYAMTE